MISRRNRDAKGIRIRHLISVRYNPAAIWALFALAEINGIELIRDTTEDALKPPLPKPNVPLFAEAATESNVYIAGLTPIATPGKVADSALSSTGGIFQVAVAKRCIG